METASKPSAWDRTPADLRALGYARDARHLFGRLQRVATWSERGPHLARAGASLVQESLDTFLPRVVDEVPSTDGATRMVLEMRDGTRVEAVHMPRELSRPRVTVCLSTQVGCAMGCTFCATAQMGLVRNLAAHEIVAQLLVVMHLRGPTSAASLNIVFMGMGEPLHNVEALIRALDVLCDPAGLGVAPSRVTVSTVGHLPGLARLASARYRPTLAVSVNAAVEQTRQSLMPIAKAYSLDALREAIVAWPRRPHEKVTLEYVMLAGINDDIASADHLAQWVQRLSNVRTIINIIPWNSWETRANQYRSPTKEAVDAFVARLWSFGLLVTVRRSRGRDVRAACGTLATLSARPRRSVPLSRLET